MKAQNITSYGKCFDPDIHGNGLRPQARSHARGWKNMKELFASQNIIFNPFFYIKNT